MDLNEFHDKYVSKLVDGITKENKNIFLTGDFNMDSLKNDTHTTNK